MSVQVIQIERLWGVFVFFMPLALMRELTVGISFRRLNGIMSIFTASETQVHNKSLYMLFVNYAESGVLAAAFFKRSLWRRSAISETWYSSI